MSPIEKLLLDALRSSVPSGWTLFDRTGTGDRSDRYGDEYKDGIRSMMIDAGEQILTYTCDFTLSTNWTTMVIECDGHDFHDRTKQQAAYDRARDREILLEEGFSTIRFTGSEIFHSAERCAAEAIALILKLDDQASRWSREAEGAWNRGIEHGRDTLLTKINNLAKQVGIDLVVVLDKEMV